MRKIIFVAYSLHPEWGSEAGYANTWLRLISNSYEIEVFTDEINKSAFESLNYTNTRFNYVEGIMPWRTFGKKTGLINIARKIFFRKVKEKIKNLDLSQYELIHCITPAGIYSHNKLHDLGLPLIAGPLGGGLPTPSGFANAFRGQLIKTFFRDFYYWWMLNISSGLRDYLINARHVLVGMSLPVDRLPNQIKGKCISIPDALVNSSYFLPPLSKQYNETVRILFAGRFVSNKGPLLLLDAVKQCLDRGVKDFVVEFAGFGLLQAHMKSEIDKFNLRQHVKLIGDLSKEELLNKYQTSDIFCLPTLREPGGIAILEAMSCGLPIVTTNYGGPSISVTDECGIKINLDNYQDYVNKLADSLSYLILNPDIREAMGKAGRQRILSEFCLDALNNKIIELYEGVIGEKDN